MVLRNGYSITTFHSFAIIFITKGGCENTFKFNITIYFKGDLSKGLVFGVLDVAKREIIWLEMPFTAQTLRGADGKSIAALLHKLESKLTIGQLLDMKVQAQSLTLVENADEADEAYTYEWALNPAEVTKLLNG